MVSFMYLFTNIFLYRKSNLGQTNRLSDHTQVKTGPSSNSTLLSNLEVHEDFVTLNDMGITWP